LGGNYHHERVTEGRGRQHEKRGEYIPFGAIGPQGAYFMSIVSIGEKPSESGNLNGRAAARATKAETMSIEGFILAIGKSGTGL
jgi:hypothetical protein